MMMDCSVLEKDESPQQKVWSTGFYPNLFVTHNEW